MGHPPVVRGDPDPIWGGPQGIMNVVLFWLNLSRAHFFTETINVFTLKS